MKTRIYTLALAVIFVAANIYAGEPKLKVYDNHRVTESGTTKEYISYDEKQSKPVERNIYNYDAEGRLLDKAY
ncbi:hypothetical protein [Prevotella sp. 10(H)]|uniref:hypothetical protein n=1 Tax=Prevotella sp. 10(H) TaxID=1158294 RepID=UPI0004A6B9C0|nr:hypothetical protein [Prevotella sp. 10(H)]